MAEPPRRLVTLHLPLEMGMVARVMEDVAREHPTATVSMEGSTSVIWDRRLEPGEPDVAPSELGDSP